MKLRTFTFACALVVALFLFAQRQPSTPHPVEFTHVVDLTHTVSERSPNWEGTEKSPFEARQLGRIDKDGYFSRVISLPEHFSTHMDAPAHFAAGAWTVDQVPADRLIAPLVVLDVTAAAEKNADYEVSVEDIARWEQANGHVPSGAVVLARTGWSARWDSMQRYRNADTKGAMHFPGFSLDAVKFLVEARGITGLGIDTMSVDRGASNTWPVHRYTASKNIYNLENVADLDQVPATGALLTVAPAKLTGGSGAPVRLLALVK